MLSNFRCTNDFFSLISITKNRFSFTRDSFLSLKSYKCDFKDDNDPDINDYAGDVDLLVLHPMLMFF